MTPSARAACSSSSNGARPPPGQHQGSAVGGQCSDQLSVVHEALIRQQDPAAHVRHRSKSGEFETAACGHDAHRCINHPKQCDPLDPIGPPPPHIQAFTVGSRQCRCWWWAAWASAAAAAAAAAARRRSMSSGGGADDDVGILRTDEGPDGARRGWRQRSEP